MLLNVRRSYWEVFSFHWVRTIHCVAVHSQPYLPESRGVVNHTFEAKWRFGCSSSHLQSKDGGALGGSSEREAPRDKPVASPIKRRRALGGSSEREAPRDKPVASAIKRRRALGG